MQVINYALHVSLEILRKKDSEMDIISLLNIFTVILNSIILYILNLIAYTTHR